MDNKKRIGIDREKKVEETQERIKRRTKAIVNWGTKRNRQKLVKTRFDNLIGKKVRKHLTNRCEPEIGVSSGLLPIIKPLGLHTVSLAFRLTFYGCRPDFIMTANQKIIYFGRTFLNRFSLHLEIFNQETRNDGMALTADDFYFLFFFWR